MLVPDLKLKWPNDIFWSNKCKLGGVLIISKCIGLDVQLSCGVGINVSNHLPTVSLNSMMATTPTTAHLAPLTTAQVIASGLRQLELLLDRINAEGIEPVKQLYVKHWLHSNQQVRMANTKSVIIRGLGNHGYLLVEDIATGAMLLVAPDGNRFDMLQNMIVVK